MDSKEQRIRSLTRLYYSKPEVQKAIVEFGQNREVVPRYYEGFGKRPDAIAYAADVMNLVKRGATSFHASEEIWSDPLQISSDMNPAEISELRIGWDLLIDIDSPFLDCSKIAARLLINALESHGVKNFGIKFSGSKGFHLIVPSAAFPKEFQGQQTRAMFPAWPRAICGYLLDYIRRDYNREVGKIVSAQEVAKRTNKKEEDFGGISCKQCGRKALKGAAVVYRCPVCGMIIERKDVKVSKRRLKCLDNSCAGVLEIVNENQYYYCEECNDPENPKQKLNSQKFPDMFEEMRGISAEVIAQLDLVLVAPRHLFRMPYSLHEKTALASVVLNKEDIGEFAPRDADPLKVKVRNFMPDSVEGEARSLLAASLAWGKDKEVENVREEKRKYERMGNLEEQDYSGVTEEMFPMPIKKLLAGLHDGRKRGLFVLLTFLRSLNFSPEQIFKIIHEWNEKNQPPLKEGYLKSQLDWHLRQKRKILPPNYDNPSYYKDLGLIEGKIDVKNPLVEVGRALRKSQGSSRRAEEHPRK